MNAWVLPDCAEIGGNTYKINADFRDVLDVISRLNNSEQNDPTGMYVAMALFYEEFNTMPESDYGEAVKWLFDFINCGETDDGIPRPKTIDWEQDQVIIVADINCAVGQEIRALPFLHWWTFIGWFNGIGDGQLATVVSLREKLRRGKKLSDWERDFYRANRAKVDFKVKYTAEEDRLLKELLGK